MKPIKTLIKFILGFLGGAVVGIIGTIVFSYIVITELRYIDQN